MRILSAVLVVLALIQVGVAIHIQGNQLVDDKTGQEVILQGVSHSGTEFACIGGQSMFDGPTDDNMIKAILSWNVNAVRVPLNEDCWLSINGPETSGENYKNAIGDFVKRLNAHGLYVIIELHWTGAGSTLANGQQPMPNTDHSTPFWAQCAEFFKNEPNVIYEVFNEPYPDRMSLLGDGWRCFRDGGSCAGISYNVAGMQSLVDTIRSTGAQNVIIVGGLAYSNDLSEWLKWRPIDPLNQLGASVHIYNFNWCNSVSCWESQLTPIAKSVPLIVGEFGSNDCEGGFSTTLIDWALGKTSTLGFKLSHLAWTWNTWDCKGGPSLISDYNGTCTNSYGCTVKQIYLNNKVQFVQELQNDSLIE